MSDVQNEDAGNVPEAQPERPADQTDTPEGMKRVHVVKAFGLRPDEGPNRGQLTLYKPTGTNCGLPGYYDMSEIDADHWYTQMHSDNPPDLPPPIAGTARAVEEENKKIARKQFAQIVEARQEHDAVETVRRNRQRDIGKKLGDSFEQSP